MAEENQDPIEAQEAPASEIEQGISLSHPQEATTESDDQAIKRKMSELGKKGARVKKEAAAASEEITALRAELERLRIESDREKTLREKTENELKRTKASRELDSLKTPAATDPIERGLERLIRIREYESLAGSGNMQLHNPASGDENNAMAARMSQIERQLEEERRDRYQREREEALRTRILSDVERSLEPTNKNIEELNSKISKNDQASNSQSALVASIGLLDKRLAALQSNTGALALALLGGIPTQPPNPAPAAGSSVNPYVKQLEAVGLVERSTPAISSAVKRPDAPLYQG